MSDRVPAEDLRTGWYARIETATDDWFAHAEMWLRRSARSLLMALIVISMAITAVMCMVVAAVGTGRLGGAGPHRPLSADQITETYGAEQFHLQLTAQAEEAR